MTNSSTSIRILSILLCVLSLLLGVGLVLIVSTQIAMAGQTTVESLNAQGLSRQSEGKGSASTPISPLIGISVPLVTDPGDQSYPVVAYSDQDRYLLAWSDIHAWPASAHGKLLDTDLISVTDAVLISEKANDPGSTTVWNPTRQEWVVAFPGRCSDASYRPGIVTRRVLTTGMVAESVCLSELGGYSLQAPQIAYNADDDEYLVIWADTLDMSNVYPIAVFAARAIYDGETLTATERITIAGPSLPENPHLRPDVWYDVEYDEYLVVWEDGRNGGINEADIYGQRIGQDGSLIGQNFVVDDDEWNQRDPSIEHGLVVFVDRGHIVVLPVRRNIIGQKHRVTEFNGQGEPQIVWDSANEKYLITWVDRREFQQGNTDLLGAYLCADSRIAGDIVVINDDPGSQVAPQVAVGSDEFVVVWSDYGDIERPSGDDIYGQRLLSWSGGCEWKYVYLPLILR